MTTWMMCSTVCRRCGKLSICCLERKQGHRVRALGVLRQLGTRFARKEGSSCGHELSLGCPLSQSPWQLQGTYVYASCLLVLGMKNDRTMRLIASARYGSMAAGGKLFRRRGEGGWKVTHYHLGTWKDGPHPPTLISANIFRPSTFAKLTLLKTWKQQQKTKQKLGNRIDSGVV